MNKPAIIKIEPWMTLKEQKPEEGEKVFGLYLCDPHPAIITVERKVDNDEYEAFNNDNDNDMGEPDFWAPMPLKEASNETK